tara:strand:+ start:346 stop:759 length:414 start_codon:yes stop_codon:yes gene_type:complete
MASKVGIARSAVADAFTTQAYRFPPGDENVLLKYVALISVRGDQEHFVLGTGQGEILTVEGVIFNKVNGGNETESAVAEDAALLVLKELEDAIISDSTLGGSGVFHCRLTDYECSVLTQDGSLIARVDFSVSVESHL